jgi:hypothetical protein
LQVLFTHRALQHRARAVVALLAFALLALGVAACGDDAGNGGGGVGANADAETLLTQTFTGAHEMSSGRVDLELTVTGEGGGDSRLQGPIELRVSGPFQAGEDDELPAFDLMLQAGAQGTSFSAGLTSTSERLFVNVGDTAYEVPASLVAQLKQSYREAQDEGSGSSPLDLAGVDPMSWLRDPRVVGSEQAGGVETDHITAGLNVDALLDDVDVLLGKLRDQVPAIGAGEQIPERIPPDTRRDIEQAVKSAVVDVWTGRDDRTLRKLTLRMRIEPPEGSDAPRSIDLDFSVELDELNEPQTIEEPTSTRPLSELLGQLQGLLGGGGLGGGGDEGAAPNIDEYTQCLEDAGSDVEKAQQCADLLTR